VQGLPLAVRAVEEELLLVGSRQVEACRIYLSGDILPFLEIFRTRLDKVLCSLLWVTLLRQEGWTG